MLKLYESVVPFVANISSILWIETALVFVSLTIALTCPSLGASVFARLEEQVAWLAGRRSLSVVVVGILAMGLRAALLPIEPIPQPIVHDEFGYLLASDTFAHGRLTNPTHPLWTHFESFNILQRPTYQSYPQPAQGIILAMGTVLFGHPFWGVLLSAGIMCGSICWMLQGWMPARWALLGGWLALLRFGGLSYWANSYWGGALGATGGALVIGALPRIKRSQRMKDAALMAFGLILLANTRPYEGFVFSLPIAVALIAWMLGRQRPAFRISLRRVIFPIGLLLAVAGAGMSYYFWRITGSPFRMPYSVERQTYAVAPYFLWQPVRPRPIYLNPTIERMYAVEEMSGYKFYRSPLGIFAKLLWSWRFYLGPVLTFPLLMLRFVLPAGFSWRRVDGNTRFFLLVLATSFVALELECFFAPHYPAPIASLLLALVLIAMRQISRWQAWGKPSGLFLVRAIPAICAIMFVVRAAAGPLHLTLDQYYAPAWYQEGPRSFGRETIETRLERMPGQQLVIVHYEPSHEPFDEWVYNAADIDHSKVVWARQLGPGEDERLVKYFAGRQVWWLDADAKPPRLELLQVKNGKL